MGGALRRILRRLWEYHGAPKLDDDVPRYTGLKPRNVTASRAEIDAILSAASPSLRLWLLLCSDLGMRSGTAAGIAPHHYDQHSGTLRFTTKFNSRQTLPVTAELRELLDACDLNSAEPFVWQVRRRTAHGRGHRLKAPTHETSLLRTEFRRLLQTLKITKRIIPHDLRRTTAVRLYRHTGDLRVVQSLLGHRNLQTTLWYLDHDLDPVNAAHLESIKRPFLVPKKEQTA